MSPPDAIKPKPQAQVSSATVATQRTDTNTSASLGLGSGRVDSSNFQNRPNDATSRLQFDLAGFMEEVETFLDTDQKINGESITLNDAIDEVGSKASELSEKYASTNQLIVESMSGDTGEGIFKQILDGLRGDKGEEYLTQLRGTKQTFGIIVSIIGKGTSISGPKDLADKLENAAKIIGDTRKQFNGDLLDQGAPIVKVSGKEFSFKQLLTQSIDSSSSGVDINQLITEPSVSSLLDSPLIDLANKDSNIAKNQPDWVRSTLLYIQGGRSPLDKNLPAAFPKEAKEALESNRKEIEEFITKMPRSDWDFTKNKQALSKQFADACNNGGVDPKAILLLAMKIYVLDRAEKLSSRIIEVSSSSSPSPFQEMNGAKDIIKEIQDKDGAFSKIQDLTTAISTVQAKFKEDAKKALKNSKLEKLVQSAFGKFFNQEVVRDPLQAIVGYFNVKSKYKMFQTVLISRVTSRLGKEGQTRVSGQETNDGKPKQTSQAFLISLINPLTEELWKPYDETYSKIAEVGKDIANKASGAITRAWQEGGGQGR